MNEKNQDETKTTMNLEDTFTPEQIREMRLHAAKQVVKQSLKDALPITVAFLGGVVLTVGILALTAESEDVDESEDSFEDIIEGSLL